MTAAVVVALLAAGCSSSGHAESRSDPKSAAASSAPAGPVSYGSVVELKDAAVAAGYPCRNWRLTNKVTLAAESGTCDGDSVLSTYASAADLQSQLDTEKEANQLLVDNGIETTPTLVGPNWLLTAPEAPVLRTALGGVLIGAKK